MTAATPEPPVLDRFAGAYLRLYREINGEGLAEAQWRAGRTPVPKEDTSERSQGMTNDPVPTATTDVRRVNLRNAVIAGEKALHDAERTLAIAARRLEIALSRSQSELPENPA